MFGTVLGLYWDCIGTVLGLSRDCIGTVFTPIHEELSGFVMAFVIITIGIGKELQGVVRLCNGFRPHHYWDSCIDTNGNC